MRPDHWNQLHPAETQTHLDNTTFVWYALSSNILILWGQNVNSQTIIKLKQQWPQSSFVLAKVDVISWLPDAAQLSEALSASKYDWLLIMVARGRYHVKNKDKHTIQIWADLHPIWFVHEGSFFPQKNWLRGQHFVLWKPFILAVLLNEILHLTPCPNLQEL